MEEKGRTIRGLLTMLDDIDGDSGVPCDEDEGIEEEKKLMVEVRADVADSIAVEMGTGEVARCRPLTVASRDGETEEAAAALREGGEEAAAAADTEGVGMLGGLDGEAGDEDDDEEADERGEGVAAAVVEADAESTIDGTGSGRDEKEEEEEEEPEEDEETLTKRSGAM